jgi:acetyl-CoA carboxylase carboxyl transferase subunit beta
MVCAVCGYHGPMPAGDRVALLVDRGTFRELDRELVSVDPLNFIDLRSYRERLAKRKKKQGCEKRSLPVSAA